MLCHAQVPSYDGAEVVTKHYLKKREGHFVADDDNGETVNFLAESVENIQIVMIFLMNLVRVSFGQESWANLPEYLRTSSAPITS